MLRKPIISVLGQAIYEEISYREQNFREQNINKIQVSSVPCLWICTKCFDLGFSIWAVRFHLQLSRILSASHTILQRDVWVLANGQVQVAQQVELKPYGHGPQQRYRPKQGLANQPEHEPLQNCCLSTMQGFQALRCFTGRIFPRQSQLRQSSINVKESLSGYESFKHQRKELCFLFLISNMVELLMFWRDLENPQT